MLKANAEIDTNNHITLSSFLQNNTSQVLHLQKLAEEWNKQIENIFNEFLFDKMVYCMALKEDKAKELIREVKCNVMNTNVVHTLKRCVIIVADCVDECYGNIEEFTKNQDIATELTLLANTTTMLLKQQYHNSIVYKYSLGTHVMAEFRRMYNTTSHFIYKAPNVPESIKEKYNELLRDCIMEAISHNNSVSTFV